MHSVEKLADKSCKSFTCLHFQFQLSGIVGKDGQKKRILTEITNASSRQATPMLLHEGCLNFVTQESTIRWSLTLYIERTGGLAAADSGQIEDGAKVSIKLHCFKKSASNIVLQVQQQVD